MMINDTFVPLAPANYFQLKANCRFLESFPLIAKRAFKKYALPDTSQLLCEEPFAEVGIGWNTKGIALLVQVSKPFEDAFYPEISRGDSVEIFIDTRDVKSSGYNTRFCHHFFFLPKPVENKQKGEKTHFRTEDSHELASPDLLFLNTEFSRASYALQIAIPKETLYGFDPEQFARIGFSYRINRYRGEPQHFSALSSEYQIEQQPSLWASLTLTK